MCAGGFGSDGIKHTDIAKKKISDAHKGKKWRLGAIISDETRNKISRSNLGKKRSRSSVEKMIKSKIGISTGVGRKLKVEHKNNISKGMIKAKDKSIQQYDLNMKLINEWNSISEAANTLKIPNSNIVNVCKGNRKTAKNFIWKYK